MACVTTSTSLFVLFHATKKAYLPKETVMISDAAEAPVLRIMLNNLQLLLARPGCKDAGTPGSAEKW